MNKKNAKKTRKPLPILKKSDNQSQGHEAKTLARTRHQYVKGRLDHST